MIKLEDTVDLMLSDDKRKRLVAEYAQAEIRRKEARDSIDWDKASYTWKETNRIRAYDKLLEYNRKVGDEVCEEFGNVAFSKIRMWITYNDPLTIFDDPKAEPKEEPIKLKDNDGEVKWHDCGNGRGFLFLQPTTKWELMSPEYDTKEEAIKEWNKMVRKMNGEAL